VKKRWLPIIGATAVAIVAVGVFWAFPQERNDFNDQRDEGGRDTVAIDMAETDGVKHSIPLDEIIGGGPVKDGIPSIDEPKFVSVSEASFLSENDPGIAVEIDGISRFYPYQILVWHEIVNDTFNGQRVLVTYCPLCLSGIVFDPVVQGERVEFGTSGKLWNSNLVMYDRKTDSLWPQILGEAVVGPETGTTLPILASDAMTFGKWKAANPDGEILSRDTGAKRQYGDDPYGSYYTNDEVFFPLKHTDDRLDRKAFVLGLLIEGKAKAYDVEAIKRAGEVSDDFAGKTFVLRHDQKIDAVRVFEKKADGSEERINPLGAFWFSWAAAHPESELYK